MNEIWSYDETASKDEKKRALSTMDVYCGICGMCETGDHKKDGICPDEVRIKMLPGVPAYRIEAIFKED